MIDLKKFEREELPRIKRGCVPQGVYSEYDVSILIQSFEAAMEELREERQKNVMIKNWINEWNDINNLTRKYGGGNDRR